METLGLTVQREGGAGGVRPGLTISHMGGVVERRKGVTHRWCGGEEEGHHTWVVWRGGRRVSCMVWWGGASRVVGVE